MADTGNSVTKDGWFAGFAAGEASFLLARRNKHGLAPCFVIGLRADDLAILEELCAVFGGTIRIAPSRGRDKPVAYWTVASKRDMAKLVDYFDRHPLRAKKARDYTVWRHALQVYCTGGQRAPELRSLRDALMAGRKYAAGEAMQGLAAQIALNNAQTEAQLRLVS